MTLRDRIRDAFLDSSFGYDIPHDEDILELNFEPITDGQQSLNVYALEGTGKYPEVRRCLMECARAALQEHLPGVEIEAIRLGQDHVTLPEAFRPLDQNEALAEKLADAMLDAVKRYEALPPVEKKPVFDLGAISAMSAQGAAQAFLGAPLPESMSRMCRNDGPARFEDLLTSELEKTGGYADLGDNCRMLREQYGNADFDVDLEALIAVLRKIRGGERPEFAEKNALENAALTLTQLQQGMRGHIADAQDAMNPPLLPPPNIARPLSILLREAVTELHDSIRSSEEQTIGGVEWQYYCRDGIALLEDAKTICNHLCRQLGLTPRSPERNALE